MAEATEEIVVPKDQELIQTVLSEDDLPTLLNLLSLHGVADKWEEIATFLKVGKRSIAVVRADPTNVEKKLFNIMRRWLSAAPSIADLIDVLRNPFIGENQLALEIERQFYPQSSMPPQKSISSSAAPSHHALGFERSESSPPAMALKVAAKQQDASTQVDSKPESQESLGEGQRGANGDGGEQKAYECGCGNNCSLTDIISGKCSAPKSKSGLFPTLATKHLSESDRKLLSGEITTQFQQISKKYASLTSSLRSSLKQQGITPEQLAEKLMDLEGFLPLRKGEKRRLLEDRVSEFSEARSIEEIFRILKEYCSFYNHEIIKYIVEELGTKDDKAKLEKYREDFTEYCRRSVFECPFSSGSEKSSHFVDLVMKVDSDTVIEPYTVKALELFHTQVAKLLQVTKYTLHLWSVEHGCLKLAFHIPRFLKTVIFPLNADQRSSLKELGVAKLDCGGAPQPLTEPKSEKVPTTKLEHATERKPKPTGSQGTRERQESESRECLDFKLLGRCRFGNRCKFHHVQPDSDPVKGYVPFPEGHLSLEHRSPIGRKGHSRAGKGYIVVQSNRDPTKEVMVIGEDEDAVEYARGIIFSHDVALTALVSSHNMATPGDDSPQMTRSNEELLDMIQQWNRDNSEREIVVIIGGKSGTGKSTLINNFLSLDGNEAAEARIQPTSVTHNVKVYKGEVSGVRVRAVDMPGLHARRHSSDREKKVIATLSHHTEGKADILIYCISLTQRLDPIDERNIATLNKAFGEKLWANAILVVTHADTILEDEDNADKLDDIVEEFAKEFEEILADCADIKACAKPFSFSDPDPSPATEAAPDPSPATEATPDPTQATEAVPETAEAVPGPSIATEHVYGDTATTEEADSEAEESLLEIVVIPTGKKQDKPPGWKDSLLAQVITICQKNTFSYLTKLEGVSWEKIVKKLKKGAKVAGAAGAIGGASGAAVGTGIGAAVGGVIGGILTAPIGGVGAVPTAAGGAALGGLLGSLFGGGGAGVVALLAGGLATAHNENLFKDIAFYYEVQKKLEELQKKRLND